MKDNEMIEKHGWILAVLEDIKNYAELNGLSSTSSELQKQIFITSAELEGPLVTTTEIHKVHR